jgi:hypothetical protein
MNSLLFMLQMVFYKISDSIPKFTTAEVYLMQKSFPVNANAVFQNLSLRNFD